jgi:hypothetical protein
MVQGTLPELLRQGAAVLHSHSFTYSWSKKLHLVFFSFNQCPQFGHIGFIEGFDCP